MNYMEKKQILEGLTDEELGQQLSDLTYEVLKLIKAGEYRQIKWLEEDLEMAHDEWEYRNQ